MICDEPLSQELWFSACSCNDAAWMIRRIWQDTNCPSVRKSQLFAIACARHVWHLLPDERLRRTLEIADRYADGLAGRAEAEAAANVAFTLHRDADHTSAYFWLTNLVYIAAYPRDDRFNDWKAPNSLRVIHTATPKLPVLWMHDIFGNPFRPISLTPAWLTPAVLKLAHAAYDNRLLLSGLLDNGGLAVLGDALEEAGCDNPDILSHLRGEGPHVRGCWPVDLILGKS
jgi:hypothetical protein